MIEHTDVARTSHDILMQVVDEEFTKFERQEAELRRTTPGTGCSAPYPVRKIQYWRLRPPQMAASPGLKKK
jgi:hypothetical protein